MNKVHLIGNAHLDPVWLWRWQEGFNEVRATFRSALDRMNEFEDFKFTSACSAYYMWIEKSDKAMFEEIKKRVKEGRWCITGGWFIQPDCNIPSGESFARHALISQRYFYEKFGTTAKTGYNVDSFGHNGSLPKILKNSGMDNYVFMRPMNHEKELPDLLFKWQSMDGSSVNTYRIPIAYGINLQNFSALQEIADADENSPMMAFYGVGNHGGGPTVELLEKMHSELDGNFIYSTPDEYFEEVKELDIPVVCDDLQYHAKGCYSACSQIKGDNRASEKLLIEAEKYSALSNVLADTDYPSDEITRAWKNVLFNQFHDILGGCSIKEAYKDALWSHGEAMNIASQVSNFALQQIVWNIDTAKGMDITAEKRNFVWINKCTDELGIPVVVFNPLPFDLERSVQISYPAKIVKTDDGEIVASQTVRASKTCIDDKWETAFTAKVPALGYAVYRLHTEEEGNVENTFVCTDNCIENEKIKVSFNYKTGEISSIFIKEHKKELLKEDTKTVLIDESDSDTWAHDIKEFKKITDVAKNGSVKLIESGPVRATIRSTIKLSDTEIIRDYTVEANSSSITVKTKVDFHEKHKMLKFTFPSLTENPKTYAKIPFGFIERPTDGTEQVCNEWAAICDDDGGIVISNQDKYSFDADKNVLSLTILRGAIYADHCFGKTEQHDEFSEYMEQGIHTFQYKISPFESLEQAERESQIANFDFTAITDTFHKGNLPLTYRGIEISKTNIAVTALKKQEDGNGWILRCYETKNEDTEVEISLFGTKWKTSFAHSQVKTFIVTDGNVSETNFIEWR